MDEEGYILFVRKNAIQILIPKFGLEGTVYLTEHKGTSLFVYHEEVGVSYSQCLSLPYVTTLLPRHFQKL